MAKCEFCDKGVTFGIQAREGDREGHSHSRVRLHQMPPFR